MADDSTEPGFGSRTKEANSLSEVNGHAVWTGLTPEMRLTVLAASIHALHFPSYMTWPPKEVCEDCQGKAGVHACGCWAQEDSPIVCGECSRRAPGGQLAWVNWPCKTLSAVMNAVDD